MGWSLLATQFSCQLAFGVLLAMAFVPRAPVGVLFYRVMGTSVLALVGASIAASLAMGTAVWSDPVILSAGLAIVAYPFYSGPVRGRRWGVALGLGLIGTAAAVYLCLVELGSMPIENANPFADLERGPLSQGALLLGTATALATGTVAGAVGLAMVLGHWYLTVPNLSVTHLERLNKVTIVALLVCSALVAVTCFTYREPLSQLAPGLFNSMGLFHLGSRIAVGLGLPLLFAAMAASSLRFSNTRSATGILYASTVLVLIGAALSVSLQDTYGIPL